MNLKGLPGLSLNSLSQSVELEASGGAAGVTGHRRAVAVKSIMMTTKFNWEFKLCWNLNAMMSSNLNLKVEPPWHVGPFGGPRGAAATGFDRP